MSHQNWIDVSDSDTSTEREDDEELSEEQVKVQQKVEPVKQISQALNFRQRNQEKNQTNKNFPKPEQIIQQLKKQDRKVNNLNINYCFHYKQEQLKEMFPMITKINNYKQGSFQVIFASKQDTIKFIEQKIANNIKFYLKIPFVRPQRYNNKEFQFKKLEKYVPRGQRREQLKPRIIQEKKQIKQVQKVNQQKNQKKASPRYFNQNKVDLNKSSSSSILINEIQSFKLFLQFARLRIICAPQMKQFGQQIVEEICKQIDCHYQIDAQQSTIIFILKQGKNVIEVPQKNQALKPKIEQKQIPKKQIVLESSKKQTYTKPKRRQQKVKEQKRYLKHNVVQVKSNMDFNDVINQIRKANIFEQYGALRFKTTAQNMNLGKQLIKRVQIQFKCKIIKQQISEQSVIFILQQLELLKQQQKVKKKYIEKKQKVNQEKITLQQNKLTINSKFNINQVISQIKAKILILKRDFNTIKIITQKQEFRNDTRNLVSKISEQFKWKKVKQTIKQSQEFTKLIIDITLEENSQQKQQLIIIGSENQLRINENVNVSTLIAQFKIKRKAIFERFRSFRFKLEEVSNSKIEQIKLKLKQQPLLNIQIQQKHQIIQIIISQKTEDHHEQRQRRKVDTSKIHDFLQRGDKRV